MIVVAVDRPDLAERRTVAGPGIAKFLLDRRIDEDALDLRVARSQHDQLRMFRRPDRTIDRQELVLLQHRCCRNILALAIGERALRHRRQPNIGVKADLVGRMPRQHRAAARLGDVAEQQARPADLFGRIMRKLLNQRDHLRVAPTAVARQPHRLPGGPVGRDRDPAGKATLGVEPIGIGSHFGRQGLGAEQRLGRRFIRNRIVGNQKACAQQQRQKRRTAASKWSNHQNSSRLSRGHPRRRAACDVLRTPILEPGLCLSLATHAVVNHRDVTQKFRLICGSACQLPGFRLCSQKRRLKYKGVPAGCQTSAGP